jgi:hypothetical protein
LAPEAKIPLPIAIANFGKPKERVNLHLQRACASKLYGQNAKMDDTDDRDPGEVFAIPDLYAPSKFLSDTSQNPSFLFAGLKLYGMSSSTQRSPKD